MLVLAKRRLARGIYRTATLFILLCFYGSSHSLANSMMVTLDDVFLCEGEDLSITAVPTFANPQTFTWEIDTGSGYVNTGQATATFSIDNILCSFKDAMVRVSITYANPANDESGEAQIHVNCNSTIGCHNHINIGVDANCNAFTTPDMFISNFYHANFHSVTFEEQDGTPIPGNNLGPYVNQTVIFKGQDRCGLGCWGYVTIEDKSGSMFENCGDYVISCAEFEQGTVRDSRYPIINSNCSSVTGVFTYEDDTLAVMCLNGYANAIERTWIARTEDGDYIGTCSQRINIEILDISGVVFPPDIVIDYDPPTVGCEIFTDEYLSPENLGFPEGITCPNFNWFYEDIEFPVPCIDRKILRRWTVINWCNGDIVTGEHTIKVHDNDPPLSVCPVDVEIPTYHGCDKKLNLDPFNMVHGDGALQFWQDCSEITTTVEYLEAAPGEDQPLSGSEYTGNGVIMEDDGTYTLPQTEGDWLWVRYRFEDACGNMAPIGPSTGSGTDDAGSCYFEIHFIEADPLPDVCETTIDISLDEDGYAEIFALEFEDLSHQMDDCHHHFTYEIKRVDTYCTGHSDDLDYGPSVHFCCTDAGVSVTVMIRLTDPYGNEFECNATVDVEGDPTTYGLECPDDIILECDDDYLTYPYPDFHIIGTTGSSTCNAIDPELINVDFDDDDLSQCGSGVVTRTLTVRLPDGTIGMCSHDVTIKEATFLNPSTIYVESMITINGCSDADNSFDPDVIGGRPVINSTSSCLRLDISYNDTEVPADEYGVCFKIRRVWTIVDLCYEGNDLGGTFTFEQYIKVSDNQAPIFLSPCTDIDFYDDNGNCGGTANLMVSVRDNCTPSEDIEVRWTIDVNNDGDSSNDLNGFGNDASGSYPPGTHKISWTAEDLCGNISTSCMYKFTIGGYGTPVPVCITNLAWSIGPGGFTELWASDFNLSLEGDCPENQILQFSFTDPIEKIHPSLSFDCSHVPDGVSTQIPLTIWIINGAGQVATCDVTLTLFDSANECPNIGFTSSSIEGRLKLEDGKPLSEVQLSLEDMTMEEMKYSMSDEEGTYAFEELVALNDYMLKPEDNKNHLLGVSTLDIILIQKHILGIQDLDSPYKMIAADVNSSSSISTIDIIEIRKLILGIYDEFPSANSWTFIPDSYEFIDPTYPWNYEDEVYFPQLDNQVDGFNFTAVKMGDVNNTAYQFNGTEVITRSNPVRLNIDNIDLTAGEEATIEVRAEQFENVQGFQFALTLDQMELLNISSSELPLTESHYSYVDGQLILSYHENDFIDLEGDLLFTLEVAAFENTSIDKSLKLDNKHFKNEAYQGNNLKIKDIKLTIGDNEFENVLGQNIPNPFTEYTDISFTLKEAQNAVLTFYDPQGKVLKQIRDHYPKGETNISVSSKWFTGNGVVYYQLETESFSAIKKMVILN